LANGKVVAKNCWSMELGGIGSITGKKQPVCRFKENFDSTSSKVKLL
jgi:hypothetical protein